jgi:hypothetical protein
MTGLDLCLVEKTLLQPSIAASTSGAIGA